MMMMMKSSVDVIKVRMQADRSGVLYRGLWDAVLKIHQMEGWRGFIKVKERYSCS